MRSRFSTTLKFAAFAVLGGAAACTVFNDLTVDGEGMDAGRDAPVTMVVDSSPNMGDDDDSSTITDAGSPDAKDVEAAAPVTYLSFVEAAHACVLMQQCSNLSASIEHSLGLPFGDTNFSSCMTLLSGPIPPVRGGTTPKSLMACVANANSCEQAGECLPIELVSPDDTRCTGVHDDAGLGVCKDGDLYNCDPDFETQIFHCTNEGYAAGSSCMVSASGQNLLCATTKGCSSPFTSCSGEVLSICYGNTIPDYLTSSRNCTVSGQQCGTDNSQDSGPITDCLSEGTYDYCASHVSGVEGSVSCNDAGVIATCADFYSMIFDCRQIGATCVATASSAYCHRSTDECAPTDTDVNTCNGSVLSLCVDGKKTSLDCASVGATCTSGGADAPSFCK